MKDKLDFYINGSWIKSESTEKIEVINPANEELIGHILLEQREILIAQSKLLLKLLKHINTQPKKKELSC